MSGAGVGKHPLELHLDAIGRAVGDWLEVEWYRNSAPARQMEIRKAGLMPVNLKITEPPEPYRLWSMCRSSNSMWWSGGVADQPYILSLEFAVCEAAYNKVQQTIIHMEEMLRRKLAPAQA